MSFDRLIRKIVETKNPTVVGLDPKLEYIPEELKAEAYAKYGKTLYLPMDNSQIENFFRRQTGEDLTVTAQTRLVTETVEDILSALVATRSQYVDHVQEPLRDILRETFQTSGSLPLGKAAALVKDVIELAFRENGDLMQELLAQRLYEDLEGVALFEDGMFPAAHDPDYYLAWMAAGRLDSIQNFTSQYIRTSLTVACPVDVEVYDGEGSLVASIVDNQVVTDLVPAAVWGEREIRDMYGLIPVGLPDQRRLVLPDDWPEDMHPLRKDAMDYRLRPEPTTDSETYAFINEGNSDARVIPVGPLHITSDEPGHFRLFVDGEQIVDADYRLFYVHRGMEKLAETRMGYNEVTFLSDRVCGICGFAHSVAYTNSVENALGIEVPQRAHTIRSILLEVERLHSHLLNLGLSCHFVGFDTKFTNFIPDKKITYGMFFAKHPP